MKEQEWLNAPKDCDHHWEPISMVFETQLLDSHGGVIVRQPDISVGKTYFICRRCATHTYMTTQWVGYRLYGSEDAIPEDKRGPLGASARNRPAWRVEKESDEIDFCWSRGPRVGDEGLPVCFRLSGHEGPHRSHPESGFNESWGGPQWSIPEDLRERYWSPEESVEEFWKKSGSQKS